MRTLFWLLPVAVVAITPLFVPQAAVRASIRPASSESDPLVKGVSVLQAMEIDRDLLAKSDELCVSPRFSTDGPRGDGAIRMELLARGDVIASKDVPGRGIRDDRYVMICTETAGLDLALQITGLETADGSPTVQLTKNTLLGKQIGTDDQSVVVAAEYRMQPWAAWPSLMTGLLVLASILVPATVTILSAVRGDGK